MKEIELLLNNLRDEWSRTGKTKKEVYVNSNICKKVAEGIADIIDTNQKIVSKFKDVDFDVFIEFDKCSYIAVRLAKKILKARSSSTGRANLDKEELELFNEIMEG